MSDIVRPASLDPTAFVAPGAVVLGDVTLKARASVWFNTVIRGDSAPVVVGEDSNLQDNSVVHEDEGMPALIGARVTVGHRAIIHGCVIEDDCLIGMGSVVLSGARIGAGSLIGAASLVRERQSIPPGSLALGSPARVVGLVTDAHRAAIQNGASHYAELARFYMRRGLARGADPSGAVTHDQGPMTPREWSELVKRFQAAPGSPALRGGGSHPPTAFLLEFAGWDRTRLPLVEAALRESTPPVMPGAPVRDEAEVGVSAEEAQDAWGRARRPLVAVLERLGPRDWIRLIGHPTRGVRTLGDWLREWVDEDVERGCETVSDGEARS